jgi:hypothetical protein
MRKNHGNAATNIINNNYRTARKGEKVTTPRTSGFTSSSSKDIKSFDTIKAFDILISALSSNDEKNKELIEKYLAIRGLHGANIAANMFPQAHYIIIEDPLLKQIWEDLLITIDSLQAAR